MLFQEIVFDRKVGVTNSRWDKGNCALRVEDCEQGCFDANLQPVENSILELKGSLILSNTGKISTRQQIKFVPERDVIMVSRRRVGIVCDKGRLRVGSGSRENQHRQDER